MRRAALRGSAAILIAWTALGAAGCGPDEAIRPNLVLITADAVRPDWLTCYGARVALGAEACALGDHGATYEWAFATAPSGGPSAASLLTSTYPTQHGVSDDPSSFLQHLGPPTLAEVLRAGGYATGAFVGSPELNRSRHLDRGFDQYDDRASMREDGPVPSVGERARAWTSSARDPWFVWVHFSDPHGPFEATGVRAYRSRYSEALQRLDRQLSQLIAVLDNDTTAPGILLTGLHGQGLGEEGTALGHGYDLTPAQIRVPLLWRSPRSGGGTGVARRIGVPVSLIDVAPTLVEAAGLRRPDSFEGAPLPHSNPTDPGAAVRTLFAVQPSAVAVIRGADLAVFPLAIAARAGAPPLARAAERRERLPLDDTDRADGAFAAQSTPEQLRTAVSGLPSDWRRAAGAGPDRQ